MGTKGEKGQGWNDLGDGDWHVYIIDTMCKTDIN